VTRQRLVREDHVLVPLAATSLPEALDALIQCLENSGAVRDLDALRKGIHSSQDRAFVNISPVVSLPHFRTDSVDRLVVALGVTPGPIRADSPDARVVTLVLAPTDIQRLLRAASPADVIAIPEIGGLEIQSLVTVADILHRDAPRAAPDMSMRDAVLVMLQHGARALPVVGVKGEVLGIVSESDVLRGMRMAGPRERNSDIHHGLMPPLAVRDVMTRSVMCIAETTGLEEVANLMIKKDVEQFPVVRDGRFTGLVTRGDILHKLYGR
jgi:CBS domain-containing protein/mannitol/fructose-specific phosphotransferase system IIA component (Ntr-type)